MLKVQVPATSANIGAGFDSIGIALSMHNTVYIEEWDGCDIAPLDGAPVPNDENNLIYKCARRLYELCGAPFRGLRLRQENAIPMTRGLGSSSACVVAGLLGANALLGNPVPPGGVIDLAARIEGHPDNSTPALLGGFVASVFDGEKVHCVKVPLGEKLRFAAFIPDFELSTEKARAALPSEVSMKDAVYNLSRAALLSVSMLAGAYENLAAGVGDRLHQPYRLGLVPGAEAVMDFAASAGAYGSYLSGAGPTIMAIVPAGDGTFAAKAEAFLRKTLPGWRISILSADDRGACVADG